MNKNTEEKFSKYVDPTGEFTNRELKMAEWYLQHKIKMQNFLKWFLIVWCVVTVGYSFGYWLYYGAYGYFQDQKMNSEQLALFQNYDNLKVFYSPKQLQISETEIYNSVSDNYELVSRVSNPNERWLARISYKFTIGEESTPVQQATIFPGSESPLIHFGYISGVYPASARLIIEDIKWQRIRRDSLPDIEGWLYERTKMSVENFDFIPGNRLTDVFSSIINFDIFNSTSYSFWNPIFYVELKNDSQTVGFIYLSLDKLKSGESRPVSLRSFVDNLQVSDIVLWPAFDVFDRNEYMPVGE